MPVCATCGQKRLAISMGSNGICLRCEQDAQFEKSRKVAPADLLAEEQERALQAAAAQIILTTEAAPDLQVDRRLDIITAEVVIGMHLFKDIASAWRDVFGGRSKGMQDGLREARKAALSELRREAASLGADAVLGVDLDYSEISGGGKSMLFLVASGTAVTLRNPA